MNVVTMSWNLSRNPLSLLNSPSIAPGYEQFALLI